MIDSTRSLCQVPRPTLRLRTFLFQTPLSKLFLTSLIGSLLLNIISLLPLAFYCWAAIILTPSTLYSPNYCWPQKSTSTSLKSPACFEGIKVPPCTSPLQAHKNLLSPSIFKHLKPFLFSTALLSSSWNGLISIPHRSISPLEFISRYVFSSN